MVNIFKTAIFLALLFVLGNAHDAPNVTAPNATAPNATEPNGALLKPDEFDKKDAYEVFNEEKLLGPHELFGNPFGNPNDYQKKKIKDDFGTPIKKDDDVAPVVTDAVGLAKEEMNAPPPVAPKNAKSVPAAPMVETPVQLGYKGEWKLFSDNSGVSSMHAILLPKIDKVLMYDATIWKISKIELQPKGKCRILNNATGEKDCWCHSVLFDANTAQLTTLELNTDTWCSSGGLTIDGSLVSTGGYQGGANTVRYLGTCQGCDWREYPTALADRRWYSTQATLADGGFIVVGGREAFSFEYIPKEGQSNAKPFFFEFLRQTSDPEENNLYPFVYLSTDGNVFIFANSRSVLLSPKTNQIVREFPVLPGGSRNYPASAASVLLPIKIHNQNPKEIVPSEVMICGGSAHKDSYSKAEKQIFYTALEDCGRMRITAKKPVWKRELMPTPRIMGDMMILATGEVLILNGAKRGASGWGFAREPNLTPLLYRPFDKRGARFTELAPSTIPRMYHSTSTVLPEGTVLVAGSNTNNGYIYDAMYPTELRVEKYYPPYLNPGVLNRKPEILSVKEQMTYNEKLEIKIKVPGGKAEQRDIKVTMYCPAFTTHGVSMNQRLIQLGLQQVVAGAGGTTITATSPHSSTIAPPGYYMLSVVHQGVPSITKWVQIK